VLFTCELCAPTGWFYMVLGTVIPAIVTVDGRTVKVGFLVFWSLSRARSLFITSKQSLLIFTLLFFDMVFCLRLPMYVSPTVSLAQLTRDNLSVILCKVVASSSYVTIQLGIGVSLWVSSSSSNGSSLDRPCTIQS
jgi:hypothetical protein